jgi:hypothetical protein
MWKPPIRILQVLNWECFSWWGYNKANTFNACCTYEGLDKTIWFNCCNDVLKQCGLDLAIIYVNTRVLEFWVVKITNIYDFLHLLSLIKIRPNMDFGGQIWHLHIYATIHFFFSLFLKESGERVTSIDQSKREKTHRGFYSFFFYLDFQIRV